MKKYENPCVVKVEEVPFGTFVKVVTKKGVGNKVYFRREYDRSEKKYCLDNFYDVCDTKMVKKGTLLYVGFTF